MKTSTEGDMSPTVTTSKTGRRTGTGSAAVQPSTTRAPSAKIPFMGFKRASLLSMIRVTGHTPPYSDEDALNSAESLQTIAARADRPIVVFAEGTTSNGRGLLRFAEVFGGKLLSNKTRLYLMCVRFVLSYTLNPAITQCHLYDSLEHLAVFVTDTTHPLRLHQVQLILFRHLS